MPRHCAALPADLVVVGAGVVGLAHAIEARARGLSVVVVERDARAVGALVRNVGHVGTTLHARAAAAYAAASLAGSTLPRRPASRSSKSAPWSSHGARLS